MNVTQKKEKNMAIPVDHSYSFTVSYCVECKRNPEMELLAPRVNIKDRKRPGFTLIGGASSIYKDDLLSVIEEAFRQRGLNRGTCTVRVNLESNSIMDLPKKNIHVVDVVPWKAHDCIANLSEQMMNLCMEEQMLNAMSMNNGIVPETPASSQETNPAP